MTFYLFIFSYFLPSPVHEHEMVLQLLQLLLFSFHNILLRKLKLNKWISTTSIESWVPASNGSC